MSVKRLARFAGIAGALVAFSPVACVGNTSAPAPELDGAPPFEEDSATPPIQIDAGVNATLPPVDAGGDTAAPLDAGPRDTGTDATLDAADSAPASDASDAQPAVDTGVDAQPDAADAAPDAADAAPDAQPDAADAGCPLPGEVLCGGVCTDLTSDPNNCGACAHVCSSQPVTSAAGTTATCSASGCLYTLASNVDDPLGVAIDSANVYFTAATLTPNDDIIGRVPIAGGSVATLANGVNLAIPQPIAVSNGTVYWINTEAPISPWSVSASDGGVAGPLYAAGPPYGTNDITIATDGAYLFFGGYGANGVTPAVIQLDLGGGYMSLATTANEAWAVAYDANNVYWADTGDLVNPDGTINQVSRTTKTVTTLATGVDEPLAIAVDATSVYWIATNGSVYSCLIGAAAVDGGGNVTTLHTGSGGNAKAIALDTDNVYWAQAGSGMVLGVAKTGGPVTTIASGQDTPEGVAADGTSVYWINDAQAGSVMRWVKP